MGEVIKLNAVRDAAAIKAVERLADLFEEVVEVLGDDALIAFGVAFGELFKGSKRKTMKRIMEIISDAAVSGHKISHADWNKGEHYDDEPDDLSA
jgi:hypothetical protein